MALKIERGGWVLIFLIGLALVGYSLNRYGVLDVSKWFGSKSGTSAPSGVKVDPAKPLPVSAGGESKDVRVRVHIWLGCVGGLVANGGVEKPPGALLHPPGLQDTLHIIDE